MVEEGSGRSFAHPGRIAVAAAVVLVASTVVAIQAPVPEVELDLARWANGAPGALATVLWPVMQLGTVTAPLVIAVAVGAWRRSWWPAVAIALAGTVAWMLAKAIKDGVERGRPHDYLDGLRLPDGPAEGFGFVSGHSAVAAATLVATMAALPARWRPPLAVVAGLVGLARIVYGVHLPADVLGGWALGTLVALAIVTATDRLRASTSTHASTRPPQR